MKKSHIPDDLKSVLRESDINTVFRYFEKEFHLSKTWRIEFQSEFMRQPRNVNEVEFFCYYLLKAVEPLLKQITRRKDNICFAAIRYILRDRIKIDVPPMMYLNRDK